MSSFQLGEGPRRHLKILVVVALVLMLFKPFALIFYHQALTLGLFSITSFLQFLLAFDPTFPWVCQLLAGFRL
jgi:hypothetical protein